jgi:hypothetical protein
LVLSLSPPLLLICFVFFVDRNVTPTAVLVKKGPDFSLQKKDEPAVQSPVY